MKAIMLSLLMLLSTQSAFADTASFYGFAPWDGRKTASGDVFRTYGLTCASNTHKMGTMLKVTNKANGKSITCKVNDRGGFAKYGRTIDMSYGAFTKIANPKQGVIKVSIKKL